MYDVSPEFQTQLHTIENKNEKTLLGYLGAKLGLTRPARQTIEDDLKLEDYGMGELPPQFKAENKLTR
jgi:hypothetical protein